MGDNLFDPDYAFLAKYDASGTLQWTRQFGTSRDDWSESVSADGIGNVYVAGYTMGELGETHDGLGDAFLSKYDASGTLQWTRQFGTNREDVGSGVSTDELASVYVSGTTAGSLEGTNTGEYDVFLSKYDASGTLLWNRQFGTNSFDLNNGISADGLGSVYVTGYTEGNLEGTNAGGKDAFLAKFTTDSTTTCDFDSNFTCDIVDADALVREIVAGTNGPAFDLTADGSVDDADLSQWLSDAAAKNGFAVPYLHGDANLDGSVNASDLNALGQNWLRSPDAWQFGDFNADGIVNAGDLNNLGQNWQQSIPTAALPVPEPVAFKLLLLGITTASILPRTSKKESHVA